MLENSLKITGRWMRCMDRIHKMCSTTGKTTGRIFMVRVETYKETKNFSSWWCVARCGSICPDASKKRAKQRWAVERPKLDYARQLRGIFFIEPNDEEFQPTMKAARRKLEVPMPAAILRKIPIESSGWLAVGIPTAILWNGRQNTLVLLKPTRARDQGWKELDTKPHQDHITAKGTNSFTHYSLVHKIIPMPQALKKMQRQQWRKNGKKLEKILAWQLTKVRNKTEVIDEARTSGATVHFASLMDICHLKNAELETKHQKYKGRIVLRGNIVKDDSGSYAAFTEQGSSASQMTAATVMYIISRLPRCAGQAADAVSAYHQVKMEDAPK